MIFDTTDKLSQLRASAGVLFMWAESPICIALTCKIDRVFAKYKLYSF